MKWRGVPIADLPDETLAEAHAYTLAVYAEMERERQFRLRRAQPFPSCAAGDDHV